VRVECPPHYDSFAEFHYSYHYGDCYIPHIEQSEPLQKMCAHFIDSIERRTEPQTCGSRGLDVVRILEATTESLEKQGAPVFFNESHILPLPVHNRLLSEAG
jgi:predicted dehydrogenase